MIIKGCTGAGGPHRLQRACCWRLFVTGRLEIPDHLKRARKVRQTGLAASAVFLAMGTALLTGSAVQLPSLPSYAGQHLLQGAIILGAMLGIIAASEAQKDRLVAELHNGRLYIQWNAPPRNAPRAEEGAIEVRSSGSNSSQISNVFSRVYQNHPRINKSCLQVIELSSFYCQVSFGTLNSFHLGAAC